MLFLNLCISVLVQCIINLFVNIYIYFVVVLCVMQCIYIFMYIFVCQNFTFFLSSYPILLYLCRKIFVMNEKDKFYKTLRIALIIVLCILIGGPILLALLSVVTYFFVK